MITVASMTVMTSMTSMTVVSGVGFMVAGMGMVVPGVGRIVPVVVCSGQWVSDLSALCRHPLPMGGLASVSGAVGGVVVRRAAFIRAGPAVPVMVLWHAHSFLSSMTFMHTCTGYPFPGQEGSTFLPAWCAG